MPGRWLVVCAGGAETGDQLLGGKHAVAVRDRLSDFASVRRSVLLQLHRDQTVASPRREGFPDREQGSEFFARCVKPQDRGEVVPVADRDETWASVRPLMRQRTPANACSSYASGRCAHAALNPLANRQYWHRQAPHNAAGTLW
jgi:hypothetical protein